MTAELRAQVLRRQGPVTESSLSTEAFSVGDPGPREVRIAVRRVAYVTRTCTSWKGTCRPIGFLLSPAIRSWAWSKRWGRASPTRPSGIAWASDGWRKQRRCDFCTRGRENLCPHARFTGYDQDGGTPRRPTVLAAYTFPIPARFADAEAASLLCAGIIGYRSLGQADAAEARRIALYGFGGSAHLALQVSGHLGKDVAVVTRGEEHRRIARELGAAWVGGPGEAPPWAPEAAVVFAPSGQVVRDALEALRPGGRSPSTRSTSTASPRCPTGSFIESGPSGA